MNLFWPAWLMYWSVVFTSPSSCLRCIFPVSSILIQLQLEMTILRLAVGWLKARIQNIWM